MSSADAGAGVSDVPSVDPEGEYEYEYDGDETEIFLVDLDLSSVNGVIRPRLPSRKKPIATAPKPSNPSANPKVSTPTSVPAGTKTGNAAPGMATGDAPHGPPLAVRGTLLRAPEPASEIQVLELHSHNPVIACQNEIYSCTWSDMIGTNMFFSEHDEDMEVDPLRTNEDYDLVGTSRIKLIGRKARLTDRLGRKGGYRNMADDIQDEGVDASTGKGLGTLRSSNPTINKELRKQAKFLENLMDAKRAKGQTDNVRTLFRPSKEPRGGGASTMSKPTVRRSTTEIEELNRRVVRGDGDALRRLQTIYSELDEQQAEGSVLLASTSAPAPGSTWHGSVDENSSLHQRDHAESD